MSRLKGRNIFKLRKSTPDLSEWGKHDAKLIEALNKNDLNKLGSILTKKGISPTKLDPSGQTVFHRAAAEGKTGAVQVIINHKADINARDAQDRTPLHYASKNGHIDTMRTLLRVNASPLYEDKDRQTPLHFAAAGGHLEAIQLMMKLRDPPINVPDMNGLTPVFLAAQHGHREACEELIIHGALLDFQDNTGRTPLMFAAEKGSASVAELLINNGANVIVKDKKGHDAIWYASNFGRSEVEQLLRNVPRDPSWQTTGEPKRGSMYRERSVDSGRGGTPNGHHASRNSINMDAAMAPMPDHSSDSSDDEGYLVPVEEHPDTMRTRSLPPPAKQPDKLLGQSRAPPDKYDEKAYKALEQDYDILEAELQRTSLENKHLNNQVAALEKRLTSGNLSQVEREHIQRQIKESFEKEMGNLHKQLNDEKIKTSKLSDQIKLLQFQLENSDQPARLATTGSEKELRELSAFGDIQEAHEKEVGQLDQKIKHLQKAVDDYCEENSQLKNRYHLERAKQSGIEEGLAGLQDHIDDLRSTTTATPIDVDITDLLENRAQIDYELQQVQEMLEGLKKRAPGGPIDSSPFHEIEKLQREKANLVAENAQLQQSVTGVQKQIAGFQELATINDQLMRDNAKLSHDFNTVLQELDIAKNRKPVIIDGPDNLLKYNAELDEENERLRKENSKLLSQLTEVQTDIEKTMSKLPSIEEFVATQQENDLMKRNMEKMKATNAKQLDALQNSAIEHEDLQQKVEDMRVMLAAVTSGDWQQGPSQDQLRQILALREMVERLKEQNDVLELEKMSAPKSAPQATASAPTAHSGGDPRELADLRTQNIALREMVERLKEQMDILESDSPHQSRDQALRRMNEDLITKNKALEGMISQMTQELAGGMSPEVMHETKLVSVAPVMASPPHHGATDLEKENAALKHMVSSLREKVDILENDQRSPRDSGPGRSLGEENRRLRADIAKLEGMLHGTVVSSPGSDDLLRENTALREMVERLKEQNEILSLEKGRSVKGVTRKTSGASSHSSRSSDSGDSNDADDLKVTVDRQRQHIQILESQLQQRPDVIVQSVAAPTTASAPQGKKANDNEVIALREMVIRLREQNEILESEHRPKLSQAAPSSPTAAGESPRLQNENIAMNEMIIRLREQNELFETQLYQMKPQQEKVTATGTKSAPPAGQSVSNAEVIALREMVERLKEQNDILESERRDRPRKTEIGRSVSSASSASSASSVSHDSHPQSAAPLRPQDDSSLKKENKALKEMVERLKEQVEILESEHPRAGPDEIHIASVAAPVASAPQHVAPGARQPSKDLAFLQSQNTALTEMVDRLREQNQILEAQSEFVPKSSPRGTPTSPPLSPSGRASLPKADTKELIALREMVHRLKEQNEILESEQRRKPQVASSTSKRKSVDGSGKSSDSSSSDSDAQSHDSTKRKPGTRNRNAALEAMVFRLKEQNEILEAELDNKKGPSLHVDKSSPRSSTSRSSLPSMDGDLVRENIALKEMVHRLKEQNDMLEQERERPQAAEITMVPHVSSVPLRSAPQRPTSGASPDLQKENIALKEMVDRLREQTALLELELQQQHPGSVRYRDRSSGAHRDRSPGSLSSHSSRSSRSSVSEDMIQVVQAGPQSHSQPTKASPRGPSEEALMKENIALREMVERLKEQAEIDGSSRRHSASPAEYEELQNKYHTLLDALSKKESSPGGDPNLDKENRALREMVASQRERIDILERDPQPTKQVVTKQVVTMAAPVVSSGRPRSISSASSASSASSVSHASGTERNENDELKALVAEQKAKIKSLEAEKRLSNRSSLVSEYDEGIRLRAEIQRLEDLLSEAQGLETFHKEESGDLDELRGMVKMLNERNQILEAGLQHVTGMKDEIGKQRAINEQLQARNKGLEVMIQQLTIELTDRGGIVEPQEIQLVEVAAPVMAAPPVKAAHDKEKDALREMVHSLQERIDILEKELDKERSGKPPRRQRSHTDSSSSSDSETEKLDPVVAVPVASDLEQDNMRLREHIAQLEGMLMQLSQQEQNANLTKDTQIQALQQMLESQKERIDILELELLKKPKEVQVAVKDTKESDALQHMVSSQKERIDILEGQLEEKPKEIRIEVVDTKANDGLQQMVFSQKERIEILEGQLEQKPKEIVKEVVDRKPNDALVQMVESQKERIDILEREIEQKPKEIIKEVVDTKTNDGLLQIVDSQIERIEILEHELDQKPKETVREVIDKKPTEALMQMVESQKERIEILERQRDEVPSVVVREIPSDISAFEKQIIALKEMVDSLKERNKLLEGQQNLEETKAEKLQQEGMIDELAGRNHALEAMIIQLQEELVIKEQAPQVVQSIPTMAAPPLKSADNKELDALRQMLASQKERIEILEGELHYKPGVIHPASPETQRTVDPDLHKKNQALEEMVKSQQERIDILEKSERKKSHGSDSSSSDSSDDEGKVSVIKPTESQAVKGAPKKLEPQRPAPIRPDLVKENEALKQMVVSQKERIDILEQEGAQKPGIAVKPPSPGLKLTQDPDLLKKNQALEEMVKSLKERNDILEKGKPKRPRTDSKSSTSSDSDSDSEISKSVIKPVETKPVKGVPSNLSKEHQAMKHIIESQKERIEILEMEGAPKPPVAAKPAVNPDLQKENNALKQIVQSQKERIDILECERPKDIQVQQQVPLKSSPSVDMDILRKENAALKAMVDSLKEQVDILGKDRPHKERSKDSQSSSSSSDSEPEVGVIIPSVAPPVKSPSAKRDFEKECAALKQMVASQKETIEILEQDEDKGLATAKVDIWKDKENAALKHMVESQKERITILEAEKEQKPYDPITVKAAPTVSAPPPDKSPVVNTELQKENDALKAMVDSLKEQISIIESDKSKTRKSSKDSSSDSSDSEVEKDVLIPSLAKPTKSSPKKADLDKKCAALEAMVTSQKERIDILEREKLSQKQQPSKDSSSDSSDSEPEILIPSISAPTQSVPQKKGSDKETAALREMVASQKERIEILEQEKTKPSAVLVPEPSKDYKKENDALKQIIDSQKERIDILENDKPTDVHVHIEKPRRSSKSSDSSDSDSEKKSGDLSKKNKALEQMVTSQKERISILEAERHQPEELISVTAVPKVAAPPPVKPKPVNTELQKENAALKAMVDSLREQISILENDKSKKQKSSKSSDSDSSDSDTEKVVLIPSLAAPTKSSPKKSDPGKKCLALEQMVASQKERIDILEKDKAPSVIKPSTDYENIKKENEALKEMVDSLKERISVMELDPPKVETKRKSSKSSVSSDSDSDDNLIKLDTAVPQTKATPGRKDLSKECAALKQMVDSQKERIDILEQEREREPPSSTHPLPKPQDNEKLLKEITALQQMVDSLKERNAILEASKPKTKSKSQSKDSSSSDSSDSESGRGLSLKDKNKALQQMVESQRERISILEAERGAGPEELIQIKQAPSVSATPKPPQQSELQTAEAIVKLNRENMALKEMIQSLKEQLENQPKEHPPQIPSGDNELRQENTGLKEMVKSLKESQQGSLELDDKDMKDLIERNENLSRINLELTEQIDGLEEVARMAEELQTERNSAVEENQELREDIFQLRQLATFADDLKRERDNAIEDRARIQEEYDRLKDVMRNSEKIEHEKYQWADDKAQLQSEILGLKGTIDEQSKLLDGSERYTESLQNDNKALQKDIQHLKDQLEVKDNAIGQYDDQLKDIHSTLIAAQQALEDKDKEIDRLKQPAPIVPVETAQVQKAAPPTSSSKPRKDSSSSDSDSDDGGSSKLKAQNGALREMVESLKERNSYLEDQVQKDVESSRKLAELGHINEELAAKNKGFESMIAQLTRELADSKAIAEGAFNKEAKKENEALRQMVGSLQERINILEEELSKKPEVLSSPINTDLERQNAALKEMVASLKERKDSIEPAVQVQQAAPPTSSKPRKDSSSSDSDSDDGGSSKLKAQNGALREMVESLKERNSYLEDQVQKDAENGKKLAELGPINEELAAKNKRFENINEELGAKNKGFESMIAQLTRELADSKAIAEGAFNKEAKKENEALRQMVGSLQERINILEEELSKKPEVLSSPVNTDLERQNAALKEMVASLKERKDSIEPAVQVQQATPPTSSKPRKDSSSSDSDSDDGGSSKLKAQNGALLEMVESLKERNSYLEDQVQKDAENSRKLAELGHINEELAAKNKRFENINEELAAKNKGFESMIAQLTRELADSKAIAEGAFNKEAKKENEALRQMVGSLQERINILEEELSKKPEVLSSPVNTDLERQNAALKEMVASLKERKDSIEPAQVQKAAPPTSSKPRKDSSSSSDSDSDDGGSSKLKAQNGALREMVESLKERNTYLEDQVQKDAENSNKLSELGHINEEQAAKNKGFESMIAQLTRELADSKAIAEGAFNKEAKKENEALRQMVGSLQERINILEEELSKKPEVLSSPVNTDLERQNAALKEMVASLKERKDSIEPAQVQKAAPPTSSKPRKDSSSSSDSDSDEGGSSKLKAQNAALQEMVASLKERNQLLENLHQKSEDRPPPLPTSPLPEDSISEREHQALKEMVVSLKEENSALKSSPQTATQHEELELRCEELLDENDRLTENIGRLQSLLNRAEDQAHDDADQLLDENQALKEQLASLQNAKTQLVQPPVEQNVVQTAPLQSVPPSGGRDDREIEALRAMVASLKEENDRLRGELDNKPRSDSDPPPLPTSPVPDDGDTKKQNIALTLMVQSLKEENERLVKSAEVAKTPESNKPSHNVDEIKKENIALKMMVESLREENERLAKNLQESKSVKRKGSHSSDSSDSDSDSEKPVISKPVSSQATASKPNEKEVLALKAMVESLKEENERLAKSVGSQPQEQVIAHHVPTSPRPDSDHLTQENTALRAMVDSLKDRISSLEQEDTTRRTPEFDKLTAENSILKADVQHLESVMNGRDDSSAKLETEVEALRAMVQGLKEENEILQSGKSDSVSREDLQRQMEKELESLRGERSQLQDNNDLLSEQVGQMKRDFDATARQMRQDIDELCDENERLKALVEGGEKAEEVKQVMQMHKKMQKLEKSAEQVEELKDSADKREFGKLELMGEIDTLKDKLWHVQKELDNKTQEALYLQTENTDLRSIIHTIPELSRMPPDQLAARMKEENMKLQNFIQMLETKVDKILSSEGGYVAEREPLVQQKMSLENQLLTVQRQMEEERAKNKEIISTYRTHLLAAVQNRLDPEVAHALQHIIQLRVPDDTRSVEARKARRVDSDHSIV